MDLRIWFGEKPMAMEAAFLQAIEANPRSSVARRLRPSLPAQPVSQDQTAASTFNSAELSYQAARLGKRWATLRLGGCTWEGPIERLRLEWQALASAAGRNRAAWQSLLEDLFRGVGLREGELEPRARDYLIRVLSATPADHAEHCRLEGVRWFSPLTVLVEAVHDLADHSLQEKQAVRAFLAERMCADGASVDPGIMLLVTTIARWLRPGHPDQTHSS